MCGSRLAINFYILRYLNVKRAFISRLRIVWILILCRNIITSFVWLLCQFGKQVFFWILFNCNEISIFLFPYQNKNCLAIKVFFSIISFRSQFYCFLFWKWLDQKQLNKWNSNWCYYIILSPCGGNKPKMTHKIPDENKYKNKTQIKSITRHRLLYKVHRAYGFVFI